MYSGPKPHAKPVAGKLRIGAIDAARGVALLAMALYHFTWDLEFFGYVMPGLTAVGGWKVFARCIASSFLFLAGVSLVLAHGDAIRWRGFRRRWTMVAGAAVLISVVTWFATPDSFIFFGILHEIALASLLGLALLRLPWLVNVVIAGIVVAIPFWLRHPVFDQPWLWWLGLAPVNPRSNDYVPLFPWFAAVAFGMAAAQAAIRHGLTERLARLKVAPPFGWLGFLGRHSLAFYLVHQPVLIGCVWLAAQLFPAQAIPPEARFTQSCRTTCGQTRDAEFCSDYCACMLDDLAASGQLPRLFSGSPDDALRRQVSDAAGYCTAAVESETPEEPTP